MTAQSRTRRVGWIALLAVCTGLYLLLHLSVRAVKSDVIRSERQIVRLEQEQVLLETEFETRANLLQLAAWNQVDFGYTAPSAGQFLDSERQLASFGGPRAPGTPRQIRVTRAATGDTPAFPKMVSPLTGKPIDEALLEPRRQMLSGSVSEGGPMRIELGAVLGSARR